MDENLNQNTTQNFMTNNSTAVPQPAAVPVTPITPSSAVVYGGFFERLVAVIIDAVIVGLAGFLIGIVFGVLFALLGQRSVPSAISNFLGALISWTYSVYFISQKGQTLGKKAMSLRVQSESTGQNLDVVSAILREVVGKFLSGAVLLLGFLWMLWDGKKQTWHDKIAKSVVIKVK